MDPLNLLYYATVCAILSLAAPHLGRRSVRLAVGAAVGLIASGALPLLRGLLGAG